MGREWRITVWGVRGSAPRPAAGYLEYGGNTACISLEWKEDLVILDAGSGLSCLGQRLTEQRSVKRRPGSEGQQPVNRQQTGGPGFRRLHILLSHLHLDHVLGLFQFSPFYDPDMEIHLYGGFGFRKKLEALIGPPLWPVGFREFRAKPVFHELCPGETFCLAGLDGLSGCTMEGNHPDGSLLYRLDERTDEDGNGDKNRDKGKAGSLVYGLDCEINEKIFPVYAAFAKESSLLIWDAGFVQADLQPGWGHSTWEQGIGMRHAAGAKRVMMTHYNWAYSDAFLRRQEAMAADMDSACIFGKEGMVIAL